MNISKDIIILTADLDAENLLKGLLPRLPRSDTIEEFSFEIYRHPMRDAGCYNDSHSFLRPFIKQFNYALVIFDHDGCGHETENCDSIESAVKQKLSNNGWDKRCEVIAIEPELENWIWMNNSNVEKALNWTEKVSLYKWLKTNELLQAKINKPVNPKETLKTVLRKTKKSFSSGIHHEIASNSTYKSCEDRAFKKLRETLRLWFQRK